MTPTTLDREERITDVTDGGCERWEEASHDPRHAWKEFLVDFTWTSGKQIDRMVPVAYFSPEFRQQINRELDRLGQLQPNWDMEGAPAIDADIIKAARLFAASLPKDIARVPAVVPSAAGNLQFEWNSGLRSLELEIETPSCIHYLKWDPEERIEEEDFFDIHDIGRAVFLIRWFMGGVAHV